MVHIMRIDEMAIKKRIFSEFDEIDRFNDEYLKVKKGDKYNLVDFNGNLLSDIWFDDIELKKDGTFDVKFRDDANNVHSGNFDTNETPVTKTTFKSSMNIPVLNPVFDEIDINDIVVLYEPYTIEEAGTDESVKIVAIVTYKGQQYQLGKDGELYDFNNKICFNRFGGASWNRYTLDQLVYGYEHNKKEIMDFIDKYENGFYAIGERVADAINARLKSLNNPENPFKVSSVKMDEGRYDNIVERVIDDRGAQHLQYDVTFDIENTNVGNGDPIVKHDFFADNFIHVDSRDFPDDDSENRYECYVEDGNGDYAGGQGEYDGYLGKEYHVLIALRYDWKHNGDDKMAMPLDAESEKTLIALFWKVLSELYKKYTSVIKRNMVNVSKKTITVDGHKIRFGGYSKGYFDGIYDGKKPVDYAVIYIDDKPIKVIDGYIDPYQEWSITYKGTTYKNIKANVKDGIADIKSKEGSATVTFPKIEKICADKNLWKKMVYGGTQDLLKYESDLGYVTLDTFFYSLCNHS